MPGRISVSRSASRRSSAASSAPGPVFVAAASIAARYASMAFCASAVCCAARGRAVERRRTAMTMTGAPLPATFIPAFLRQDPVDVPVRAAHHAYACEPNPFEIEERCNPAVELSPTRLERLVSAGAKAKWPPAHFDG